MSLLDLLQTWSSPKLYDQLVHTVDLLRITIFALASANRTVHSCTTSTVSVLGKVTLRAEGPIKLTILSDFALSYHARSPYAHAAKLVYI